MIISNFSQVQYSYTLPDGQVVTETKESNVVETEISNFSTKIYTKDSSRQKNIVETEILTYSFTKVKSSSKTFVQEGEQAIQTVILTNNSLFNIKNIFFQDKMTDGATIVPQSVIVNGVEQPTFDAVAGFSINDLAPSESATITYVINANNPLTEVLVDNFARIGFNVENRDFEEDTNTIQVEIVSNTLSIVKQVDKTVAVKGEQLLYTTTITNTGSSIKNNLFFFDPIPVGTTFVNGSVKVDGVSQPTYNPSTGFALADLGVGLSTIIEFNVVVN